METKKGFDLADMLKDVSKLDTSPDEGREQIEYIDIDKIESDPGNFYQLTKLDDLASNIEVVGLQQPLRVRASEADPERVVIVSGHRRRAALDKLVKDGRKDLRMVPCIRERVTGSAALQELRLIYANRDTRVISSAELAKQVERVEMLLYQLKKEGFEFPGRMRDHVAQACKISAPKLARLKVIREKLVPKYMQLFERDKLPEQTAYALARLPADFQSRIFSALSGDAPKGNAAERVLKEYAKGCRWEPQMACPDGKACKRGDAFLRRDCEAPSSYALCGGTTCCLECDRAIQSNSPCERMCSKAKAQRKVANDKKKEAEYRQRQKAGREYQKETQPHAKRLLRAIDAAGVPEDAKIFSRYYEAVPVSTIRQWAAGEFDDPAKWYCAQLNPRNIGSEELGKNSKLLNCSTDFLMGLTEDIRPAPAQEEPKETPERPQEESEDTENWASCDWCKSAHPGCEDCCASCEDPCNAKQRCRKQEPAEVPEISQDDISDILDQMAAPEEPVRHIRWEKARHGVDLPVGKLILTFYMTSVGPEYRPAEWDGSKFHAPGRPKKELTGLQYTDWLELPLPGSGEICELAPVEQAEGQLMICGWMPGGRFPAEPCDVVADFRGSEKATYRMSCRYDGRNFRYNSGILIDLEVVRWMRLPEVLEGWK